MKHYIIYTLIFLTCGAFSVQGQEKMRKTDSVDYRFALGVQLGTDIGGAVPFPFKHIPETFNPYPKLNLSLGAKLSFPITSRWSLGTEFTYKTITMNGTKTKNLFNISPDQQKCIWILPCLKFLCTRNILCVTAKIDFCLDLISLGS